MDKSAKFCLKFYWFSFGKQGHFGGVIQFAPTSTWFPLLPADCCASVECRRSRSHLTILICFPTLADSGSRPKCWFCETETLIPRPTTTEYSARRRYESPGTDHEWQRCSRPWDQGFCLAE